MDSEVSKSVNIIIIFLFIVYILIAYTANELTFLMLNNKTMRNKLENCKYVNEKIVGCDYQPFIIYVGTFTGWMLVLCTIFWGAIYFILGDSKSISKNLLDSFIYPEITYMLLNTSNLITIYVLTILLVLCSIIPLTKALNNHKFYIKDITRRSSLNVLRNYNFVYNILISAIVLIFITSLIKTAYYDILFGYLLRLKINKSEKFNDIIGRNLTYLDKIISRMMNNYDS